MRSRLNQISRRLRPVWHIGKPPAGGRTFTVPQPDGQDDAGEPAAKIIARRDQRFRFTLTKLFFVLIVVLPTASAALYFGFIASDRFVSESSFVVRTAKPPVAAGISSLLQITGIASSQDDAYSVQEYILSRNAVAALVERVPLRDIFNRSGADFLARFPNLIRGNSDEELFQHYKGMVEAYHVTTSGMTMLRVQAFQPEDAQTLNKTLLTLGEELVNRMNERIRSDAIRFSEDQLTRSQERLVETQIAITEFRNRELMLDPSKSSLIVAELVGRLSGEVAGVTAQLREVELASPNSPQIPGLQRRIAALEAQINLERQRVSNSSDGLAEKIADYERLTLQREFAVKALASAVAGLELARNEARRQQLYLERVVEPHAADFSIEPRRTRNILVTFLASMMIFFIGWLVTAGIREHGVAGR